MQPFIDMLRDRLSGPLPGRDAQYKMASLRRLQELEFTPAPPPDARVACVLNLLHLHEGRWHTILIERTANPRDRHSGQVSFPGGRWEENDGELANVALRETEEEIGIPAGQVQILGQLTDLYIPVSNFLVHPFVGILEGAPMFTPQPGEVGFSGVGKPQKNRPDAPSGHHAERCSLLRCGWKDRLGRHGYDPE
ncbi:MAG: CoA pyrophosphatase [Thermoanaerobaculia bacterium]|nr:CoA pyrophosphatase [Thermoanaerobaculia bacterium]